MKEEYQFPKVKVVEMEVCASIMDASGHFDDTGED